MIKNVTRVLTIDEIHELTGINKSTLRRYCQSGKIPNAMKRARHWFVREDDYNAFFTPQDEPSTPKPEDKP